MASNVRKLKRVAAQQRETAVLTVTVGDLADSGEALVRLAQHQIPGVYSFGLRKIFNAAKAILEPYNATRQMLCEKYGVLSADKKQFAFEHEEKRIAFWNELNELRARQESIPGKKLPDSLFVDCLLSAAERESLDWLLSES